MHSKALMYKNSFAEDTTRLIDLISKSSKTISDTKIKSAAKHWVQNYYDLLGFFDNGERGYLSFIRLSNSINNVRLVRAEWLRHLRIILKEYQNESLRNRAREQTASGSNFQSKNSRLFDNRKLHKSVISVSKKLFYDGHYSQAIFEACKSLNKKVQELSSLSLDGKQLMLSAFSVGNPKLKFNQLQNQSDKDEQEGFMHIFAGLMQGIRNPKGHEIVSLKDPHRALEYLGFISLLFRKLDELK